MQNKNCFIVSKINYRIHLYDSSRVIIGMIFGRVDSLEKKSMNMVLDKEIYCPSVEVSVMAI